jgi:6-pyruvoyltetrahydropterin/6-carboxytetrahydropterin synthase
MTASRRITAERYHDISCGHRVHEHEGKCAYLHGHNYRVFFTIEADLDALGRVLDFSAIKERLCAWLEEHWDHRFLAWDLDPMFNGVRATATTRPDLAALFERSLVFVPFNPTAENMAQHLLLTVGPARLDGTGARLVRVRVEETRKCSASAELPTA